MNDNANVNDKWKLASLIEKNYNWDSFASLLLGVTPDEIEGDLLFLYFLITDYYTRDSESAGSSEQLCAALATLRELYKAFKELGKVREGTLMLVQSVDVSHINNGMTVPEKDAC